MVRLIITMVVAGILGGAIAYLGNQLGRYIGRKKLSIFKLRPRHTSILITTITGVLIAAGTLLFAYLSSWEVRTLFEGLSNYERMVQAKTLDIINRENINGTVYEDRDPILTAIVDGGAGKDIVTEQLKSLVGLANKASLEKSEGIAQALGTKFTPPPDGKLVGYVPEELNSLADFVSRNKRKYIVMVVALQYAFLGEKFAVGFYPIEYVPKVFVQDEEITRGTIDGTKGKSEIYIDLIKLCVEAKGVALKKGMLQNQKTGKVFETDMKTLLDASEKIGKMKQIVSVVIRSKKAVDNRGPLDVTLDIEPAGEEKSSL